MSNIRKCKETKTVSDIIVLLASDNEKAEKFIRSSVSQEFSER